ncbi:MAG: hypothetical protein J7K37_01375 [Candidatus Omnitrophica bacterium]|nr:hypothetical protein [Candidatus Omnitrophota bacterium]
MQVFKSLIAIAIVISLVAFTVKFKHSSLYGIVSQNISNLVEFLKVKFNIIKYNVSEDINPSRRASLLTFIKKQEQLKLFLPDIFENFTSQDWKRFWSIIYGRKGVGGGLIKQKVYRSKEEIEDYLIYNYPIFSRFQKQNWDYFWSIVLGNG